jgi:Uri superfamily endonuclease
VSALNGVYVLIIQLSIGSDVSVGKLGTIIFSRGIYAYVGSAQTALEKRIARHLRKEKRVFWHIDHLLQDPNAKILKVFTKVADKQEECIIAKKIVAKGETVEGFGCSDCICTSHLVRINDYSFLYKLMQEYALPRPSASS